MATQHSLRVRGSRWEKIEKKAWELSIKANKVIKPIDVADALLAKGLIYAHISLCKDQPLYIIANSRNPLSIVMGPGGDSEAKPFHPPIRAMIQDAQASWFLWWGFFCFEVRPSY